MQRTLHYNFPLFEGEDIPSIIESWNPTMAAIDAKLYALSVGNAGPEIIHELQELIATVNDLIATVNEVISNVDNVQDTVNGIQRNMSTIYETLRTLQTEIDNIAAEIPDVSQIESDIESLQTSVGSLETRVTNLGNSITAIANKAATSVQLRYASNLPVTPVLNPDTGVYEVEVPFHEYEEGATPPSEITAFNMNCQAFLYSGYDIIDFYVTMPDNERVLVTTLINNNAYKVFTAIQTYTYQDNGNDVTVRYFYPNYINAISTSIPRATEHSLGGIIVGSGLSIEQDGTLNAQSSTNLADLISLGIEVQKKMYDYNVENMYTQESKGYWGVTQEQPSGRRGAIMLTPTVTYVQATGNSIRLDMTFELYEESAIPARIAQIFNVAETQFGTLDKQHNMMVKGINALTAWSPYTVQEFSQTTINLWDVSDLSSLYNLLSGDTVMMTDESRRSKFTLEIPVYDAYSGGNVICNLIVECTFILQRGQLIFDINHIRYDAMDRQPFSYVFNGSNVTLRFSEMTINGNPLANGINFWFNTLNNIPSASQIAGNTVSVELDPIEFNLTIGNGHVFG